MRRNIRRKDKNTNSNLRSEILQHGGRREVGNTREEATIRKYGGKPLGHVFRNSEAESKVNFNH